MKDASRDRWLAINYAAAIFTSAFLLFQIQPLITKHILPWFGGGAAVWTTSLLFFQTLLFGGYAYAHLIHGRLRPRQQAVVHSLLIIAALAVANVLPDSRWEPSGQDEPVKRILVILAVGVGLPYFTLSATGPLLQAWFARAFPGRSPYRLYALSNVGSLLALVSYPFFFERLFSLQRQSAIWSAGFLIYAALCGFAAWRLWNSETATPPRERKPRTRGRVARTREPESSSELSASASPAWYHRLLWLVWPAFASIVLMATTNHVSTDIAAMPFLWIAPLVLYLLTFIIAFDHPAWYRRTPVAVLMLVAIYGTALVHSLGVGMVDWQAVFEDAGTPGLLSYFFVNPKVLPLQFNVTTLQFLTVNFVAMFAICMLCHGELVRLRPDPRYLTSFYLMIALGGALGGAFITLVAPQLFVTYFEWPISLFVASLIAIACILRAFVDVLFAENRATTGPRRYAILAGLVWVVFIPSAVLLLDLVEFLHTPSRGVQLRTRNFFGTLTVLERDADEPLKHRYLLRHGAINHGAQFAHESRRIEPITYYGVNSGLSRTIDFYQRQLGDSTMKLGVVGLGAGTIAAFADRGDEVVFYEINPAVIDIAESGRWFTYIRDCRARGADCQIKLGDARLTLQRELNSNTPPNRGEGQGGRNSPPHFGAGQGEGYHVLVLDAFSGDSIPVHLLTVEAFQLYLAHLSTPLGGDSAAAGDQQGVIAVHVSNRYLDLKPLMHGIAAHFGLYAVHIESRDQSKNALSAAHWIMLTRNRQLAEELAPHGKVPNPRAASFVWTDNHSSLFDVLK